MDKTLEGSDAIHRVKRGRPAKVEPVVEGVAPNQLLATRIWDGQSPDVSVIDRVARIAAGLKAQGFGLDVVLPHPDAARYMEAHK